MSLDVGLSVEVDGNDVELFSANITHNLNRTAEAAGVYMCCWRPEECVPPITAAAQLIPILESGIAAIQKDPAAFVALAPANKWGSCHGLLAWLREYLTACRKFPSAKVGAWR